MNRELCRWMQEHNYGYPWVGIMVNTILGLGLFALVLVLIRRPADDDFVTTHVAPVVGSVVGVLLFWVVLWGLWDWYRERKYRQRADDWLKRNS
jgi:hypothetical protein